MYFPLLTNTCQLLHTVQIVDLFVIFFDKMEKNSWGFPGPIVASLAITTLYLDVPTIRLVVCCKWAIYNPALVTRMYWDIPQLLTTF